MNRVILILISIICLLSCEKEKKHFAYVYGHGGTSIYSDRYIHPPNSMASVEYALDVLDADGVEVDVQMTKDSVLVLYHDSFLESHSNGSGCINNLLWDEIKDLHYTSNRYRIPELEDVLDFTLNRHKMIYLDIKVKNECENSSISSSAFNYAFNNCLAQWDEEFRRNVTVNSRDIKFLLALEDTIVQRSFETDDVDLGLNYVENNGIDKLCLKASSITEENADLLYKLEVPWCVFGIKTKKEIKVAHGLKPSEMISDNIAYAKKLSN